MPFTQEQRAAIESRGENLLVAAAAGSGKTTVLVERVMQLLAEGANIDEMLIVTFTRAAASELRAKLARRLMEASGALEEQSVRLERATITTIHGFCAELLRAHFESAGVSAGFRVLDEANARRMEDEALDEALEEAYAAFDGDLDALDFGRGPKKVRAMAQDLLRALDARPRSAGLDRSLGGRGLAAAFRRAGAGGARQPGRGEKPNRRGAFSRAGQLAWLRGSAGVRHGGAVRHPRRR